MVSEFVNFTPLKWNLGCCRPCRGGNHLKPNFFKFVEIQEYTFFNFFFTPPYCPFIHVVDITAIWCRKFPCRLNQHKLPLTDATLHCVPWRAQPNCYPQKIVLILFLILHFQILKLLKQKNTDFLHMHKQAKEKMERNVNRSF